LLGYDYTVRGTLAQAASAHYYLSSRSHALPGLYLHNGSISSVRLAVRLVPYLCCVLGNEDMETSRIVLVLDSTV